MPPCSGGLCPPTFVDSDPAVIDRRYRKTSRRLFDRRFLTDLFVDLALPLRREKRPDHTVKQVSEEDERRHPLIEFHRHGDDRDDENEPRCALGRAPIYRFEARVL